MTAVSTSLGSTILDPEVIRGFLVGEVDALDLPEPAWGPIGKKVYERTYSRDLFVRNPETGEFLTDAFGQLIPQPWLAGLGLSAPADGRTTEVWAETIRRTVLGNLGFQSKTTGEPFDLDEAIELFAIMYAGQALPAGRHLWTTGTNSPWSRNCWASGWSARTSDHLRYLGSRLFEGGGVGSNYSDDLTAVTSPIKRSVHVRISCSDDHPDFDAVSTAAGDLMLSSEDRSEYVLDNGAVLLSVEDTREGWVDAWCSVIDLSTMEGDNPLTIVVDVTGLRPFGAPLRTFGGTASGPAPFVTAVLGIASILRRAANERRRPSGLEFMEMDHHVAASVVAGGTRRSARMSMKHWADADILDFVHCKAEGGHWTTNISVEIDDDFVAALERGDMQAETVLNAMCEGMVRNSEPGWMNSSEHSRFEPTHIRNVNPCVTADAWVQTTEGLRQVGELVGKGKLDLVVNGEVHSTGEEGFFATGHREVLALDIDGTILKVTPEHLISTPDGWRAAGDLAVGDVVDLTNNGSDYDFVGTGGHFAEGYLLGHLVGDGYFGPANANGVAGAAHLCTWASDSGSASMESRVVASIENLTQMDLLKHRSDWSGFNTQHGDDKRELHSAAIRDLAADYGIVKGNKTVADEVMRASKSFQEGFLKALFDTDGHVEGTSERSGVSVRLTQSDPELLGRVRTMLLGFGIKSVIRSSHPEGRVMAIRGREYASRASYRLIISGEHVARFAEAIGFEHQPKAELLAQRLGSMSRGAYTKPMVGVVRAIAELPAEDVFDCQVPGLNAFVANGTVVHNCGEASLTTRVDADGHANGESCNLGSVNLESFGTDHVAAGRAFELMARFLYRATLNPYPDELANEIELTNRRIGVGFMGLQGWALQHGVKYSEIPFSDELRSQLTTFRTIARASANMLADDLGLPRPVKVTAIAPTGTISQMFGTQAGCHPVNAVRYIRRVRYSSADAKVEDMRSQGYHVEKAVKEENTMVVSFPTEDVILSKGYDEDLIEGAGDITIDQFAAVILAIQETFCDGDDGQAVSATGQLDAATTADELTELLKPFLKLKGFTAYQMGSYVQPPIEAISKDQYWDMMDEVQMAQAAYGDSGDGANCATGACPVR